MAESLWGRARGRSSDLSGFGRNGHRSFGDLRPRGRAPSETPYHATGTIHFLLYASASPPPAGLPSRENSAIPASPAPSRPARRAPSCWKPPGCARSIWCWCSAWIAGDAPWPTACALRAEESSLTRRFMISIMSAFRELEREMIVEWVVAGVKKAQAAGKHCGCPRRFPAGPPP